jgi:YfiH family protein
MAGSIAPRRSELLIDAGFPEHGFTTRRGGVSTGPFASLNLAHDVGDDPSAVLENLSRLEAAHGGDAPLLRTVQVHGNRVVDATELLASGAGRWTDPPGREADAITCRGLDAVLAVQVADCAPILVADPETGAVAAIHAGWRGAASGVILNAIKRLSHDGCTPRSLIAAIGPCICRGCYEVGEEVARRFPESVDPIPGEPGKHLLDLGYAIEVSLIAAGLTHANIDRLSGCSRCDDELYSHRGADGENCGRTLGFIRCYKG